jgi:protein-tyrosine-phosphatase
MAEAFYNEMTGTNDAESVGTQVDKPGETLEDRWKNSDSHVVEAMDELDIDMRQKTRTQLTKEMLDQYELVVRIVSPEFSPQWLIDDDRVEVWDIADPVGKGLAAVIVARDLVEARVKKLVNR